MKKMVKPDKLDETLDELSEEFHIALVEHGVSQVTIVYKDIVCIKCSREQLEPVKMRKHGFVREDNKILSSFICPLCKGQRLISDAIE